MNEAERADAIVRRQLQDPRSRDAFLDTLDRQGIVDELLRLLHAKLNRLITNGMNQDLAWQTVAQQAKVNEEHLRAFARRELDPSLSFIQTLARALGRQINITMTVPDEAATQARVQEILGD